MRIKISTVLSIFAFITIFIVIPMGILTYQANRKGLTLGEFIKRIVNRMDGTPKSIDKVETNGKKTETQNKSPFLKKISIGNPITSKPWITHLTIVDLDKDNLKDVILCDARANRIHWVRQSPLNVYTEIPLGKQIRVPVHVTANDIDGDNDLDLLIASMGMVFPNNDKIGSVVVLENDGNNNFSNRVLIKNIARVTDVRAGDLDNDGDIDLVVGQFGYDDGELRWMENLGDWNFKSKILLSLSGTINTPVADIDQDGDLDIIALVSQEWEEIYIFENDGLGHFDTHMIYGSTNEDFGSSGISMVDLDKDGDLDVLYTNGDAFDYIPPAPRPWHGVQWLENKGNLRFTYHRIGNFNGAYGGRAIDIDKDGDSDVFAVSCFNNWENPNAQSVIWFENDGEMNFLRHNITSNPSHLLCLESADMDNDGSQDLITGGFHAYPPFNRMSRLLLWKNNWDSSENKK